MKNLIVLSLTFFLLTACVVRSSEHAAYKIPEAKFKINDVVCVYRQGQGTIVSIYRLPFSGAIIYEIVVPPYFNTIQAREEFLSKKCLWRTTKL